MPIVYGMAYFENFSIVYPKANVSDITKKIN